MATITQRTEPLRLIFQNESIPVSAAFFAAVAGVGYDLEVAGMDSEALLVELESNLGITISDFNRAKVVAGQGVYFSDIIYKDLAAFIEFANLAVDTTAPPTNVFNPASVLECSVAVLEMAIIDPDSGIGFSEHIRQYWGALLAAEGAGFPFPPLQDAIFARELDIDDPSIFQVIEQRTEAFSNAIKVALWQHSADVQVILEKIPTVTGEPALTKEQMAKIVESTVGSLDAPRT